MGILRFILAITVLAAHSSSIFGINFVGGQIAVQAFYIISGFYMALILNEKYVGLNSSYTLFISNRFLRLYPIYWTVLLLTIAFSIGISIYTNGNNLGKFTAYSEYFDNMSFESFLFLAFTNIFLFFQDTVMFLGFDASTGHLFFTSNFRDTNPQLYSFLFIPQAWTVGVEISFYLIAPFLVKKSLKTIIAILLSSLLLRFILSHFGLKDDPWSNRFFPTELVFFLCGIISYRIYVKLSGLAIKAGYLKIIWSGVIGFTLFYDFLPIPHKYLFYLCLFFICLPFIFLLTKKWKYDSYIGELSYPIYISHMLVLDCLKGFKIPIVFGLGLSLTLITVLFSILLNEFVTKKNEKIRQGRLMPAANLHLAS